MRWSVCVLLLLALACTPPAPPPAPPTLTPVPPILERPPAVGSTPTPVGGGEQPEASPPPAVALAPPPTPLSLELEDPPAEPDALAIAPLPDATPAPGNAAPTPVALPPSARVATGITPTPDVVASSPVLADAPAAAQFDYGRAIKLVQDSRRGGSSRLEERIGAAIERARGAGAEVELLGWQAAAKGSTDLYRVTFSLRENRQLLMAEWEADVQSGAVRPVNGLAEGLSGL